QANDGPTALAGYNALKQAGGCGVLAKVDRPLPATAGPAVDDPRFQSRGARPLSDQVLGSCDDSPEACAARVQQLKAGTRPEAVAALYSNASGIGLQPASIKGNGAPYGVPTGRDADGSDRGTAGHARN